MKIGQLRHRVTIQQQIFTEDMVTGENKSNWQDVATVWAAVEPLKGREYFKTMEVHSEISTRVRIRYCSGISSDMRLVYGNRTLYIESVIDPDERHWELQLMCVENKPPGPGE